MKRSVKTLTVVTLLIVGTTVATTMYVQSIGAPEAWDQVNFVEVHEYADRSATAYESDVVIREKFGKGQLWIKELDDLHVKVFVERDDTARVQWIAVRGTANFDNAMLDGDYHKEVDPKLGILLHAGFQRSARAAYEEIQQHLDKTYQTRLTGHSLGGAIAAILLLDLSTDGYKIDKCITFGQPKVTNIEGALKYHDLPLIRIVDHQDLVPRVPPASFLSAVGGIYHHFGPEVILDASDSFLWVDKHDAENSLIESPWTRLGALSVDDHMIRNYQSRIAKLLDRQQTEFGEE